MWIGRVTRDPEHVVGAAAVGGGAEEVVEENEVVGEIPVVRDVLAVVVAHHLGRIHILQPQDVREPVHAAVVVLPSEDDRVVSEIADGAAAEAERLDTAGLRVAEVDRHAHALRDSVRSLAVRAEVVVEGVVLLQQVDEVVDRRSWMRAATGRGEGVLRLWHRSEERFQLGLLSLRRAVAARLQHGLAVPRCRPGAPRREHPGAD